MGRLEMEFLGGVQIRLDGAPLTALRSKKGQALLCYLAVTGAVHSRSRLAGLLWSDLPEKDAQADLRKVLSRIRPSLASHLHVSHTSLAFNKESDWWFDVSEFETAAARPADVSHLAKAAALYRGDLLDGFYTRDASLFDEWLKAQRARLHGVAVETLRNLMAHFFAAGVYEPAIGYGRQLFSLEPGFEEVHRDLMHLLSLSGQRSAALAQYEMCRRALADEFGVEPSAETEALYTRLRSTAPATLPQLPQVEAERPNRTQLPTFLREEQKFPSRHTNVFVGRGPELTRLHRFLDQALAGQGQVAFLIGEAGRGKTTLLEAFVRQAQAKWPEIVAVSGLSSALTGMGDPYYPFRAMITQLAGDVENQWLAGAVGREQAQRLWDLLPHTTEALLDVGPDLWETFVPLRPHLERARAFGQGHESWLRRLEALAADGFSESGQVVRQERLFEQVTAVLRRLARRIPLLLILDDLQWADLGTVSLLFHLGRQLAAQRILILGAYRPVDIAVGREGAPHPLQPAIAEFSRRYGDIILDLGQAVDRDFVDAYLDSMPNRLDRAFREALFQRTRGHPLFTVELWQAMQERGDIIRNDNDEWVAQSDLDWRRLPTRVDAAIGARISRLPIAMQSILRVASVEGETFSAEVVARVLEVDERSTLSYLSQDLYKAHRLVQVEGIRQLPTGRLSQFKFRHILIQSYVYQSLSEGERAYLHEAIGRALEDLYDAEKHSIALELARHFRQAGIADKAVMYLGQAGEQAHRKSANQESIALYREALTLLKAIPEGPEKARQELIIQMALGASLMSSGSGVADTEPVYARALKLSRLMEEAFASGPILIGLWLYYLLGGQFARGCAIAEELLALATASGDDSLELGGHSTLGVTLFFLGEFAAAYEHLEAAIQIYDPTKHRHLMQYFSYDPGTMAYQYVGLASWFLGYADRARNLSQEGLQLARQYSNPFNLANTLDYAAMVCQHCGDVQSALLYAEEAVVLAMAHDVPHLLAIALGTRGRALYVSGQVEAGLEVLKQGLTTWLSTGANLAFTYYYQVLAESTMFAGDDAKAWETLEKGFGQVETGPFWEAELHRLRGELLIRRGGAPDEIEASFQQALTVAQRQDARALALRALTSRSRWYMSLGRSDEARRPLQEAYDSFTEGFDTADLRAAWELLDALDEKA